jgi:hypothetical protein
MTRMVGTLFREESGSWWGSERLSISEVAARNELHSLIGYIDGAACLTIDPTKPRSEESVLFYFSGRYYTAPPSTII